MLIKIHKLGFSNWSFSSNALIWL